VTTADALALAAPAATPIAVRARRHVTRRLAPFLFVLYVLNYVDRVNISYAALQMTGDLKFSNAVFGFGAGIFFVGYFLLQIPGTMLVELWSARKFIGATLIIWGGLATLTGFVRTAQEFYWIRFFLGVAEAGFFPGVIIYLTHWYRYEDRSKAVALFMIAIPLSNLIGSVIAAFLMRLTWLGLPGWRWLLILEGVPSVLAGCVAFSYLTDWPKDAGWLPEDERAWLTTELAREQAAKKNAARVSPWRALRHPKVLALAVVCFCYITNSIGLSVWLPKIVQRISGLPTFQVTLISGIPWLMAIPAMLLSAWHSDKSGERRWHAGGPIVFVGFGLMLSLWAGNNLALAIGAFSLATMALYAFPAPFWALTTTFLSGTAAAAGIALINSIGNLGGFVGPYVIGFLTDRTGTYTAGLSYLVASGVVGGVLLLSLRSDGAGSATGSGP
jgi:ACS family tartrate transporter-like MFS transporter